MHSSQEELNKGKWWINCLFAYWNFCSNLIPISWETWISFYFKSVSLWDNSWRCLSVPSLVSFKNWLSGTVGTCLLEAPQLCVRSYDRRGMAFRYTPTTQVAVVCLVKKKIYSTLEVPKLPASWVVVTPSVFMSGCLFPWARWLMFCLVPLPHGLWR